VLDDRRCADNAFDVREPLILTPDQRVRVFVSSTLEELAPERAAVRAAIESLHLAPVMFELGARPHPPRSLYRAYLEQSHVFVAIYWQRYGWVAPEMTVSGLEDEYLLSGGRPRLVYVKRPAPDREPRLVGLLDRVRDAGDVSYRSFESTAELEQLVREDLAVLLSETFQSRWAPAPASEVPAARTALPAPPNKLIGREDDVARLRDLVLSERLVTLTGPGGIGKSRLAIEVASQVSHEFADGVSFVGLASVREPDLVPATIASALAVRDEGSSRELDALKHHLEHRRLLLVLDNFEHVLPASRVVAELLEAAPALTVMVTSREALRLRAEREYPVPSLPAREAVELFARAAAAVRHGFVVDDHNAETIDRIVTALEGVPLAIELAAARVRLLPPVEILQRLDRRLDFLSGGARDLPERQRAMRTTLDWSYELLSEADRELFAKLSIFPASFSLAAAESVTRSSENEDVLEGLTSLADKSLLRVDVSDTEPRFRLLALMREYAAERLDATGDQVRVSARHAAYYRRLSGEFGMAVRGPKQTETVDRLSQGSGAGDIDNVRACMRWYLTQSQPEAVAEILWSLWVLGWISGRLVECRGWARETLATDSTLDEAPRARLLTVAGLLEMWLGDYRSALPALNEAVEIAGRLDDDEVRAPSTLGLSLVSSFVGDTPAARTHAEEALRLCRAHHDRWGESTAHSLLTWFVVGEDSFDAHVELFEDARAVADELADEVNRAMIETNLAEQRIHAAQLRDAADLLGRALQRLRRLHALYPSSYALDCAARLAARIGDPRATATLLGAANRLRQIIDVPVEGSHRARRSALIEHVRGLHDDTALFDEALARGEAMTFIEAIEFAARSVARAPSAS
jgi:predicted ATPase/tetratricopeptide (TPR) repeat protein